MNESNAREYAARMLRILDTGLGGLDQGVAEALSAARHNALRRHDGPQAGRRRALAASYPLKLGMAAATLLAVMALSLALWWPSRHPTAQEIGQIDIRLLTGELPPGAYIDEDFPAWRRLPGLCRS